MKKLLVFFIVINCQLFTQDRYLVSSSGDVVPLKKGEGAIEVAKRAKIVSSDATVCTDRATFGYTPDIYPPTGAHVSCHRDLFAQWYVSPAGGTIDSVFWLHTGTVGTQDSLMYLRIHKSNIYPGHGPGYGEYPAPPTLCWGYYINTNDLDGGVAAFPEDATDPEWFSTIHVSDTSAPATFPPTSEELWGLGGFPVSAHANSINFAAMQDIGIPCSVAVGDAFFITFRLDGPHSTSACGSGDPSGTVISTNLESDQMKTHNWKFYEHPIYCGPGWLARGDWNNLFWYVMTVTTNIPPIISGVVTIPDNVLGGSQTVQANIEDCNPADPSSALVQSAILEWSLNGVPQTNITLTNIGGDLFEGTIPDQPVGSTVEYKIRACDPQAMCNESALYSYKVISIRSATFYTDTGITCTMRDIRTTGSTIDTSKFFIPWYRPTGTVPKDDGIAGPFDMGGSMRLSSGEDVRYAWVGVNGAICLSAAPTDTQYVSNGIFSSFNIPGPTRQGVGDTASPNRTWMGKNFIAPLWEDLMLADSDNVCGRIVQGPYPGDTCLYVVEWDSIAWFFDPFDATSCDETTFRVVLNRCDGTIEFQYTSVGTREDYPAYGIVGINLDSNVTAGTHTGWIFLNSYGSPAEMKPRNDWCIRLYPTSGTAAIDGWNMVSVAGTPVGSNYDKSFLYPTATSNAFRYQAGYVSTNPLSNGPGYWVKFAGAQSVGAPAVYSNILDIAVADKWNMIGSISKPIATSSITATGGTIASGYSGFGTLGYTPATTITPGKGYWVKMNGAGTLHMSASATPKVAAAATDLNQLNKVIIQDATGRQQVLYLGEETMVKEPLGRYELPPPAPEGFDARFTSGRMIETYPAKLDPANDYEYPMAVQTTSYPITVNWEIVRGSERKLVLSDGVQGRVLGNTILDGSGRIRITNASVKTIVIRLTDGIGVPKEFALGQNYPNPFNPITHFTVEMPKTAEVEVAIYDILGRKIVTLMSGQQAAGYHTMEWDGHDGQGITVPSGMYFVRMNVDEFSAVRKVMLLK